MQVTFFQKAMCNKYSASRTLGKHIT